MTNEMGVKHGVLFDLDGVLVDTEGTYSEFWSSIDSRYPTGVEGFSQVIKGMNLQEILGNYFASASVRAAVVNELASFQRAMRYDYFPGAMELVMALRDAGLATAVVTSSDQGKVDALCRQHNEFADLFDVIITGDIVTHAKPHPECYLLAARQLGCRPQDCFVFEDSINGLKAGMASGATVIGLTTTYPASAVAPLCHYVTNGLKGLTIEKMMML